MSDFGNQNVVKRKHMDQRQTARAICRPDEQTRHGSSCHGGTQLPTATGHREMAGGGLGSEPYEYNMLRLLSWHLCEPAWPGGKALG